MKKNAANHTPHWTDAAELHTEYILSTLSDYCFQQKIKQKKWSFAPWYLLVLDVVDVSVGGYALQKLHVTVIYLF